MTQASSAGRPAKIGIGIPTFGGAPAAVGIGPMAQAIEETGFDSAWVTDHILLPDVIPDDYPFSADGSFPIPTDQGWHEAVVALSFIAAATTRIGVGIGVCLAGLREPRLLAAQLATLDRLSGGRVALAVGAGWLRPEFDAFEVDFAGRGTRLDGALALMRACWTGKPDGGAYGPFTLPDGFRSLPTPAHPVPILVGGSSDRALRRAVAVGDGWYGVAGADGEAELDGIRGRLAELCRDAGRDPATLTVSLRTAFSRRELENRTLADRLRAYVAAGAAEITIDVAWRSLDDGRASLDRVADAWWPQSDAPVGEWWA